MTQATQERRETDAASQPRLEFLYEVRIDLEAPQAIGETPHGTRLIVPLKGGSFTGPRLRGRVVPGGADWLLVRPDGVGELDVRGTLEAEDGALIYVQYRGYLTNVPAWLERWSAGEAIAPDEYYFMITPYFETSAGQHAWLGQVAAVGVGSLMPGGVAYRVYAVR